MERSEKIAMYWMFLTQFLAQCRAGWPKRRTMADNKGFGELPGFSLLWRRQGILWWVFVVNLVWRDGNASGAVRTLHRSLGS